MPLASTDDLEQRVYACICQHEGIKAREIAHELDVDRAAVNHCLYASPFVRDLCYRDDSYRWYGVIQQRFPHVGLGEYCGWYGTVDEFLSTPAQDWLAELERNCRRIGRNLNDTRGLYHSFRDTEQVMRETLSYLKSFDDVLECGHWELAFEVRIKRGRHIRIFADVLVITSQQAFSLEFKMKDEPDPGELKQAAKYRPYLEVVLGPSYTVVPALVLTRAHECFECVSPDVFESMPADALAVCSADLLFNVFDEHVHFLSS